jgi:hypothetical protein
MAASSRPPKVRLKFVAKKVALEQGFLRVLQLIPVNIILPVLHTILNLHASQIRANRLRLGTLKKQCSFGNRG